MLKNKFNFICKSEQRPSIIYSAVATDDNKFIISWPTGKVNYEKDEVEALISKGLWAIIDAEEIEQQIACRQKEIEDLKVQLEGLNKLNGRLPVGSAYYYIDNCGNIRSDTDHRGNVSTNRFNFGNYFNTHEEAVYYIKEIKKVLKK